MNAKSLIKSIQEYCKENNLNINDIYNKLAELYQDKEYGINIKMQMINDGYIQMPEYLESKGIVDRYFTILNKLKRGEYSE